MTTTLDNKPTDPGALDEGQHTLHITDATGDTRLMWDPANRDEVATARAAFNAAKGKGMLAYGVKKNGDAKTGDVIRDFDPEMGKIVMVRQLQGG
jgi:hypothetical protein